MRVWGSPGPAYPIYEMRKFLHSRLPPGCADEDTEGFTAQHEWGNSYRPVDSSVDLAELLRQQLREDSGK